MLDNLRSFFLDQFIKTGASALGRYGLDTAMYMGIDYLQTLTV